MKKYATTAEQGYFSDTTIVYSTHKTASAALRQANRQSYIDERGERRFPVAAVYRDCGFKRGGPIYSNSYPDYAS